MIFIYQADELDSAASAAFCQVPGLDSADPAVAQARDDYLAARLAATDGSGVAQAVARPISRRAYAFMLTAGEPPDAGSGYRKLLLDLWANAYLEAARKRLISGLTGELSVRRILTPGLLSGEGTEQALDISENRRIGEFLDCGRIGVKVLRSGSMVPAKTLAGLLLTGEEGEAKEAGFCDACKYPRDENPEGCLFCFIS